MREKDGNESYVLSSMGEAYLMQNNYKKALEYQNMAFQKASKIDAKLEKIIALYGIGDTYFAQEEYSNALNFYSQALTLAEDMGSKEELKNVYERLSKSYAAIGQYLNAYNYNGLYSALKDTLFNIENEQRMEGLQFQFEIEKKEDEIELLNKENALKEAEIQRAKIFRNFLLVGAAFLLVFLGGIVYQYNFVRRTNKIIIEERNRSDQLLKNILPLETAEELKVNGSVKAKKFEEVTVIFTDFVNFTQHAETIAPEILVENIDFYFKQFDEIFERHNLEKIKTIGDAYMGAGSIPLVNNTHPVDAVKAGLEILDFIHSLRIMNPNNIHLYNIRIGINTGPVIAGVVGKSKFQYDIWGDAVNIASRMETACGANKLNISESTYQKVKDHFEFEYRGNIEVKNRGKIKMYYVTGVKAMA
jgi:class 3 adenylate cyclase